MSKLKISVLGGLDIAGHASDGKVTLTRKVKALLAYLALENGRPQSRERLADLFWENTPEEQARTSLRQGLSALRKQIGGALVTEQDQVRIDLNLVNLDAVYFEQLVGKNDPTALEDAVTIYKGDLLQGFSLKEEAFEAWIRPERERYRGLMIDSLMKLTEVYEASRNIDRMAGTTTRLLALDPLNENAHRALMRSYSAQGRHGTALKQFEICRQLLGQELTVQPQPETVQLANEIRQQRIEPQGQPTASDTVVVPDSIIPKTHPPLPNKPSLAVLPFANMTGDNEQEYFSDGITEDIITELSRFHSLFVIARNSSFSYKDQSIGIKQIAAELGVRYVLKGSVRRNAERLRITVQLTDSDTGYQIWSERYDRQQGDIFALQEEITVSVVGNIDPQIEIAEMARARISQGNNISAYDLALKAQALLFDALRMGDQGIYQQALDTVSAALEQDPRCTNALWVRAWALSDGYLYRWCPTDQTLEQAWETANRLVDIDSSDARAYTVRGFVQHFQGEHEAAVADFRYSFALNPNFAINIFMMAWCESLAGYTEEAKERVALGLRQSPRDNEIWLGAAYLALAQANFAEGDYEATEKWVKVAIQLHPRAPIRRALMIACCIHKGDTVKAKEHLSFLDSFAPDFVPSILRGELTLYRLPEHNNLLVDGLRKAQSGVGQNVHPNVN